MSSAIAAERRRLAALAAEFEALDGEELEVVVVGDATSAIHTDSSSSLLTSPPLRQVEIETHGSTSVDGSTPRLQPSPLEAAHPAAAASSSATAPPAAAAPSAPAAASPDPFDASISAELKLAPRRATHDGTPRQVAGVSPMRPPSSRKRPAPSSAPPGGRRRVRWAPSVESPRLTREALHKKARGMTEAAEAFMRSGSAGSGASECLNEAAASSAEVVLGRGRRMPVPSKKRRSEAMGT